MTAPARRQALGTIVRNAPLARRRPGWRRLALVPPGAVLLGLALAGARSAAGGIPDLTAVGPWLDGVWLPWAGGLAGLALLAGLVRRNSE